MPDPVRLPPIQSVRNFRDMGGYETPSGQQTRWGKLFRSGHLAELNDADRVKIVALPINTVIDFRSGREKERNPSIWTEGWSPEYHPTPIGGNAAAWVQELYERLSTSPFPAAELREQFILAFRTIPIENADGLKTFFNSLLTAPEGGVLFHCTAGKDRTGIAGALLLNALGVDEDQIMKDFLLTNEAVDLEASSERIASWLSEKAGRTIEANDVHPLVGVEADFLHAAYASIKENHGTLEAYLSTAMGLSPDKREKLKTLFLEG
ncbi:MAG: tyrosine-protein phosphatase [Alphaproteobacteria bacterium]|nr:tyrosine-protein phosphatase [Alphaproteobacteria bacterium]